MAEAEDYDLPFSELLPSARRLLSLHLNPEMEIPESGGHLKDWRGVAELRGFTALHIRNFALTNDPTCTMFDSWNCHRLDVRGDTVQTLINILRQLDRRDVIQALQTSLQNSSESWRYFLQLSQAPEQVNQISSASDPVGSDVANENHHDDRLLRGDRPGQPKIFDALMVHAEEDGGMAWSFTRKLEDRGLSILYMDRDLLPGGNHNTILAHTIRDRCKTMIFLATHSAVNSPTCDFLVKFAHFISPGGRDKSLLVVKFFKDVRLPLVLQPLYHLDYSSPHKRQWFWDNLTESIKTAPPRMEMTSEPTNLSLSLIRNNRPAAQADQATQGPTRPTSDEATAAVPDLGAPVPSGTTDESATPASTARQVATTNAGPSSMVATFGSIAADADDDFIGDNVDIQDARDRGWAMLS